ncbi:hypothetical protein FQR65_LT20611 [Abscondita terminalis]|nr:hypothetical protein FQR65_LT20611 [Abscondita terminalis]
MDRRCRPRETAIGAMPPRSGNPDLRQVPQNRRFVETFERKYSAIPSQYAAQKAMTRRRLLDIGMPRAADFPTCRGAFRFNPPTISDTGHAGDGVQGTAAPRQPALPWAFPLRDHQEAYQRQAPMKRFRILRRAALGGIRPVPSWSHPCWKERPAAAVTSAEHYVPVPRPRWAWFLLSTKPCAWSWGPAALFVPTRSGFPQRWPVACLVARGHPLAHAPHGLACLDPPVPRMLGEGVAPAPTSSRLEHAGLRAGRGTAGLAGFMAQPHSVGAIGDGRARAHSSPWCDPSTGGIGFRLRGPCTGPQ